MTIKEYIKDYTDGRRVTLADVFGEIEELGAEIRKMNKPGIAEEFEDVLHFMQLWLYWRFGLNRQIWSITQHSVDKFIGRKAIWNKIYQYVGLPLNISGYVGNYNKVEKVINHLQKFGIEQSKARDVYNKIVLDKS